MTDSVFSPGRDSADPQRSPSEHLQLVACSKRGRAHELGGRLHVNELYSSSVTSSSPSQLEQQMTRPSLYFNHLHSRPRCLSDCPSSATSTQVQQLKRKLESPLSTIGSATKTLTSRLALTGRYQICPHHEDETRDGHSDQSLDLDSMNGTAQERSLLTSCMQNQGR